MKQHLQNLASRFTPRILAVIAASAAGLLVLSGGAYAAFFTPTIRPNVTIAQIPVGSLNYQDALAQLNAQTTSVLNKGLMVTIDGQTYTIAAADIGLSYDVRSAVDTAWSVGRQGTVLNQAQTRATTLLSPTNIDLPVQYDEEALRYQIDLLAQKAESPAKNIRLVFNGTAVSIATDTAAGRELDRDALDQTLTQAISTRNSGPFTVALADTQPSGTVESAEIAKQQAERLLKNPLVLKHEKDSFMVTPQILSTWLESTVENNEVRLTIKLDVVHAYLADLDSKLNVAPGEPSLVVTNGKVVSFTAPRAGKALDQEQSLTAIVQELESRRQENATVKDVTLVAKTTKPEMTDPVAKQYGITELIGVATTDFSGSPANRIWNIKTGAQYLNYSLLAPGQEFTTTGTLGDITGEKGYKPELVIKGDRTLPEYGGGLCQVSTTLFRAALDAGLPITMRSNHAYRVPYYEKDGDGRYIGPGLDATIYYPNPDFRFKNDTAGYILIASNVVGNKITFSLYGTDDGRTAKVDGPYTLSTTPAGDPIYVDTDTLAPGVKKQIEHAHAGGTAIATYTVTYPDGTQKKQVFKSTYKNWPARYLVGKAPTPATPPADGTTTPSTTTPTDSSGNVPPFSDPSLIPPLE